MGPSATRSSVLSQYAETLIRFKARQLARRRGFGRSDQQDLEQEMVFHLLRQARRFDPKRASLTTFVGWVVNSSVAMLLRQRQQLKRYPGAPIESFERTMVLKAEGKLEPLGETISADDLARRTGASCVDPRERYEPAEAIGQALAAMDPATAEVCRRLMHGSPAAVGRQMPLSRHHMRRAIRQIRWHLESAGLG